ncbi:MAG: hypothetical protein ACD_84C00038G0012 [uncultured bacterium]|nr:MAG: hypothetical protein ACD_84C00038G0012 [uncultured bacterium]
MSNKLQHMLASPDKGVTKTSGANGVLSRLWRQMLLDLNVGPARFGSLLQEYILDPRNGVPNNKKDQISTRGNLTKEFTRPHMTWKVFCKGLRFLNITKVKFIVEATHGNGRTTIHSTNVNFGGRGTENFTNLLEQPEQAEFVQDVPALDQLNKDKD